MTPARAGAHPGHETAEGSSTMPHHHHERHVTVTREIQCDIGHRIPFHKARCFHVHGHRYRIIATVEGTIQEHPGQSDDGMVADFGDLKEILLTEVHDPLDHSFLIWKDDQPLRAFLEEQGYRLVVMDTVPTAENLARWCFDRVRAACVCRFGTILHLRSITVWETPNCSATYTGEDAGSRTPVPLT
jgi:6-pyruvoyltetrahydropterin/6-carboxytetrahydropterin synthase